VLNIEVCFMRATHARGARSALRSRLGSGRCIDGYAYPAFDLHFL
jgi:hypothetical protein